MPTDWRKSAFILHLFNIHTIMAEQEEKKEDKIQFNTRKILRIMRDRKITITHLFKKYHVSRSTLYSLLDADEISKPYAAMFAYALNLSPSFFGLDDDDLIFSGEENKGVKKEGIKFTSLLSYQTDFGENGNYLHFLKEYFDVLIYIVRSAEEELVILDYLANNFQLFQKLPYAKDNQERQEIYDTFHSLYKKYMAEINKKIEEQISKGVEFKYTRICQIPLHLNQKGSDEWMESKEFVLKQLYPNIIAHYEYLYRVLNFKNFKLYVSNKPIRAYSFIMSESVLASEYDRIDKSGSFYPDLLFLNTGKTGLKMIETYKSQLGQLIPKCQEISRPNALDKLPIIADRLQKESEEKSKELEDYFEKMRDSIIRPKTKEDVSLNNDAFNKTKTESDMAFLASRHATKKLAHLDRTKEELIEYFAEGEEQAK